ncbi:acyl-CoA dehydrogenase family protein [Aciduricibacillus chroicocephali]|uniref:Acyl-CoA dehydrogenase family protein n=1 Tax=Aciduricibacillus chroicocephali TaxID=3054939 RepID=A0ABY9KT69_9BACI|nr:acyl-CoA dehydrogenase family protein [Bacillaceae bacterium 44XB]
MKLTELETHAERLEHLREIVKPFRERAMKAEAEGRFPFENFEDLKKSGYPALAIPKSFAGTGISLVELLELQVEIAKADGATGLGIGWHMSVMKNIGENDPWPDGKFNKLAGEVIEDGILVNNAASEPASGSPSWGNLPLTTAKETESGWVLNGRKSFTTMAPILDYFIVSATIEGTEKVGNFLVSRKHEGVSVIHTWDSVAMHGTGSEDVVFENVKLESDDFLEYRPVGPKPSQGWLLHIPAAYYGVALAAREEALKFSTSYSPGDMEGTIADIPSVKERIGQIELRIMESGTFLFNTARKWDDGDADVRMAMREELGVAKLIVVNKAMEVVDLAMRIVGARSLSAKNPLQRCYRDVRAGLHNPPMDDITIQQLANKGIAEFR